MIVQGLLTEHPVHLHAAQEPADVGGVVVGLGVEEPPGPALVDGLPLPGHGTLWRNSGMERPAAVLA